jgi:hypothetical protein
VDDKDLRQMGDPCTLGIETGPQSIIVRQVVGEQEEQKVLDIHVVVPDPKPSIEQIVDVFIKDLEVNSVDVIHDKVIVRGEFELKTIYVACLPDQPVLALQIKHFRWTQDIDLPGARRGMDADASVIVEFVDYDVDCHSRAYKYKYNDHYDDDDDDDCDDDDDDDDDDCDDDDDHHHDHHDHDHCDDDCDDCDDNCDHGHGGHHKKHKHHHHHHHCNREFDVSVVLKIIAKVMTEREVQIGGYYGGNVPTMPIKPKG